MNTPYYVADDLAGYGAEFGPALNRAAIALDLLAGKMAGAPDGDRERDLATLHAAFLRPGSAPTPGAGDVIEAALAGVADLIATRRAAAVARSIEPVAGAVRRGSRRREPRGV